MDFVVEEHQTEILTAGFSGEDGVGTPIDVVDRSGGEHLTRLSDALGHGPIFDLKALLGKITQCLGNSHICFRRIKLGTCEAQADVFQRLLAGDCARLRCHRTSWTGCRGRLRWSDWSGLSGRATGCQQQANSYQYWAE